MRAVVHEWRLLARSRLAWAVLVLLLLLSSLAVLAGLREVQRQQQTWHRLAGLQQQDMQAQQRRHGASGDAGSVAYYSFHATWDPPSPAAFLALGLRDTAPTVLRVRALALQSQLHEGESFNPELALAGRFDYAFVLVYLAPLLLIALLHDLFSGEREAGRLSTLLALPGAGRPLWLRRAGLRAALVLAGLVLPVLVGAWASAMPAGALAAVLLASAAYVLFWTGLCLVVAARRGSTAAHAMALVGCWAVLTLVLPTLANAVLARAVPVRQGVELTLVQRQRVHAAWDLPREQTMERFVLGHPEWWHASALPSGFHWKWYYAFQQLGDEDVAPLAQAYRDGLLARQRWTERLGGLLPGVGVQALLHRQAGTDLPGQLAYQDAVAAFHARLRGFYYPYLFEERPFDGEALAAQPGYEPVPAAGTGPGWQLPLLCLLAALALAAGVAATGRVVAGRR
jgi:ABC-2 type transport system permease protein